MENQIDTNLYSRQIGTYGMETMGKLIQMKVFIYGLRGLGIEIAKNLILAGPRQVTLCDPELVQLQDLGANFFLEEKDVGKKRRDEACLDKLKELNGLVKVDICEGGLEKSLDQLGNYEVVVVSEMISSTLATQIDEITRKSNHGFIYSCSLGISGFTYVDFGLNFQVRDHDGEECKQYIVKEVTNEEKGVILIDDTIGSGKLSFACGDYVNFREVQGMTELNDGKPRQIKYVSPIAFSIENTTKYGAYTGGGIVEQVKVPKPHNYKAFKDSIENPYNEDVVPEPFDYSKFGRNELLHVAFKALMLYFDKNGMPKLNCENAVNEVVGLAKEIFADAKKKELNFINMSQEFDDEVVGNVARWAAAQISPATTFLGGVVAQEVIKFTGKYTPLNQWLYFDFNETVANLKNPDRSLKGSRYDDQIAIYGNEMQEKIQNLKIFMIGAGALGCEFLKDFAMMGIATKKGQVLVTDNDSIEISNLNRQFLFRKNNVGNSKSKSAREAIEKMNSSFICKDLQALVAPVNEHIFNDKFWDDQDFIINAVDNVKARKYIDNQCTWHTKPLIDSGTLGTKAHLQLIIPHVTSCYNDTQDPPEEGVPMCTLHNFPAMIEHCIEWGRDHFNGYFVDSINDARNFLENSAGYFADLKKEGNLTFQNEKMKGVQTMLQLKQSNNFANCVEYALKKYTENFDHKIKQLLHNFPADYKNNDGSKFWTGSKRVPTALEFSPKEAIELQFVACTAILTAQALGIKPETDFNEIAKITEKFEVKPFQPKKAFIQVDDNQEVPQNIGEEDEKEHALLVAELEKLKKCGFTEESLKSHDFEKDDDSNFHIDFIHAASNLRAQNYKIRECDRQRTKMIAGKIIPAIATTTASITGLVVLQLYTLLQTDQIEYLRGAYFNLGVNNYVITEPAPKMEHRDKEYDPILLGPVKAIPPKFTCWDRIDIKGPLTLKEFIDYMMDTYKVDTSIITCEGCSLIQTFQKSAKDRYPLKIEEAYSKFSKEPLRDDQCYLTLEVSADTTNDEIAVMPLIKYTFK